MSPHLFVYWAAALLLTVPGMPGLALPGMPGDRAWPVAGQGLRGRPVVERVFEPPPSPYAAGHRGVDLRAASGAPVRSAAPGRVAFAGPVAGRGVIAIALADGLRITYQPVRAAVDVGAAVAAGQIVGFMEGGSSHCATGCLHWGLRRGTNYLDPLSLLPPSILRSGPSRLLPLAAVAGRSSHRAAGLPANDSHRAVPRNTHRSGAAGGSTCALRAEPWPPPPP
jgi:murein DD-endopeptidase MepM/ murein hydrolase activator NlpD